MLWVHYSRSGFWRDRGFSATPKGSQSQAKGQKSTEYVFCMLLIISGANIILYSYDREIGGHPISFFTGFIFSSLFCQQVLF
ncbi:hypothetical protein CM50_00530 [Bacillus subtilis]|nr:hypothetical protein CM50_00530 [Bacillus subtilis] [Bacillus stercoris]